MKVKIKEIEFLERYRPEDVAEWLRIGFEDLFHNEKRFTAFYPIDYLVLSWNFENELHALKDIYDSLSGSAKGNFRKGIKIAILNLPKEERYFKILRKFLFLSGMVSAFEAIEAILIQVSNGFFGMGSEGQELFALSLNIIAGMSPAYKVPGAIRSLITSKNFQYTLAPLAFCGLCRAEPKKFPEHLELLRKSFSLLHKDKQQLKESFYTVKRFINIVDVKTIAENIAKLYINDNPDIKYEETDKWIIDGMFLSKEETLSQEALLKLELIKNEKFVISMNTIDAVSYPVTIPADKGDFIQYLNEIALDQQKKKEGKIFSEEELGPINIIRSPRRSKKLSGFSNAA